MEWLSILVSQHTIHHMGRGLVWMTLVLKKWANLFKVFRCWVVLQMLKDTKRSLSIWQLILNVIMKDLTCNCNSYPSSNHPTPFAVLRRVHLADSRWKIPNSFFKVFGCWVLCCLRGWKKAKNAWQTRRVLLWSSLKYLRCNACSSLNHNALFTTGRGLVWLTLVIRWANSFKVFKYWVVH